MEEAFFLLLLRFQEWDIAASSVATGGAAAPSATTGGAAASSAATGGSVASTAATGGTAASTAATGGTAASTAATGGTAASSAATWGTPTLFRWGTSQETHKLPKRQVIQPPHPPPVEGLIQGTIKEVLECRMVEPQPLCRVAELLGKRPYVSALLTEGAQGLKLEDALVEGAG